MAPLARGIANFFSQRDLDAEADWRDVSHVARRYDIREDTEGWTVFDLFTGEPVVIEMVTQTGLDIQDADELAELLDHRALARERRLRQ